jgi:dihydroorotase-like cyclic amidohydrolase
MVCPHPETIEIAWVTRARAKERDPDGTGGLRTWNDSRPPFVEGDAVQRAAYVAGAVGCPLYVVHTSSGEALRAALRLRQAGRIVHIETCPHYLTHDVTWPGGDIGKINPPLREPADREALWAGIHDGSIDTIATDHVHRDVSSKAGGIWGASPGCPGLETMLPVMISEGHFKRGVPLARIAELTASNPARLMGLAERKGSIALGSDADLVLVDLDGTTLVSSERSVSSAGYSIYDGWTLQGRIAHTMVRGRFAFLDGHLDDTHVGRGRYLKRRLGPSADI